MPPPSRGRLMMQKRTEYPLRQPCAMIFIFSRQACCRDIFICIFIIAYLAIIYCYYFLKKLKCLKFCDRQLYKHRSVVALRALSKRRLVTSYLAAFGTTVNDYESLFRIGDRLYRLKLSSALVCSVSRIYIHVKRPKTERTMITRRISKRLHLSAAVCAYKGIVVFSKSLLLHIISPQAHRGNVQTPHPHA